jgi:OPT family small oligopeptide transporter
MSRMRYFLYSFLAMFVWFWFPNFICEAMTYFNWITWIDPSNVKLAAITGNVSGLGLNPWPTWDWNWLSLDPLITPFYATVNNFVGAALAFPVIAAVWFSNHYYTGYLPINSNGVFNNKGTRYNVSRIVDADGHFDIEAYRQYSPAYLAASNILLYCFFFMIYTATVVHAYLYHRFEIINGFKSLFRRRTEEHEDVHMRLMRQYKEVPETWYAAILLASVGLGIAGVAAYPTHTTPGVVFYGLFLALIFCIPIGIIKSITNVEITLNVLAELFGGLWFAGDALSMNYFKTYGYVTTAHTVRFAQDLKLAHYTHIPPRVTFHIQNVATIVSTFVAISVVNFQMTSIVDVCSPTQKDRFTCPGINTFFTASVLWGTLGPKRMFGAGSLYQYLLFGFLAGALIPIPFYYLRKRYSWAEYIHIPVIIAGSLIYAPYGLSNAWPTVPIGFLFNYYIKRRFVGWWSRYNYITSGAFTSAIAIGGIVIFFAIQWPGAELVWSGNTRPYAGCDGEACRLFELPEKGYFGPGVGEFS